MQTMWKRDAKESESEDLWGCFVFEEGPNKNLQEGMFCTGVNSRSCGRLGAKFRMEGAGGVVIPAD